MPSELGAQLPSLEREHPRGPVRTTGSLPAKNGATPLSKRKKNQAKPTRRKPPRRDPRATPPRGSPAAGQYPCGPGRRRARPAIGCIRRQRRLPRRVRSGTGCLGLRVPGAELVADHHDTVRFEHECTVAVGVARRRHNSWPPRNVEQIAVGMNPPPRARPWGPWRRGSRRIIALKNRRMLLWRISRRAQRHPCIAGLRPRAAQLRVVRGMDQHPSTGALLEQAGGGRCGHRRNE